MPERVVLILDDYHRVQSREVDNLVRDMIAGGSSNFSIVINSRARPALDLPRLLAAGQAIEVGPDALRFSREETRAAVDAGMSDDALEPLSSMEHRRSSSMPAPGVKSCGSHRAPTGDCGACTCRSGSPWGTTLRSAARSSAVFIPIRAGRTVSSSRRSAAGAPPRAATATTRNTPAFTARPSIAPSKSTRHGVHIDQYALSGESGGAGEYRGKGICLDYRIRSARSWMTTMYSRSRFGPWGLAGGRAGSCNHIRILRRDGSQEVLDTCTGLKLEPGDVVGIVTANGGGYGDPRKRSCEKVLEDLKNGYISAEEARVAYGLDPSGAARTAT